MRRRSDDSRAELSPSTTLEDFRDFYWLKEELQRFCREQRLSPSGSKRELEARIERALGAHEQTPSPLREAPPHRLPRAPQPSAAELSMETRAPAGFRCTQEARAFFVAHLGARFRFTVPLQSFIRSNPGVTFGDIARTWSELEAADAAPTIIAPQFEYNQFTRDFFAAPENARKSRQDCIAAWKRARARRGGTKYRPEEDAAGGTPTATHPAKRGSSRRP